MRIAVVNSYPSRDFLRCRQELTLCEAFGDRGHPAEFFQLAPVASEETEIYRQRIKMTFHPPDNPEETHFARHISSSMVAGLKRFRPHFIFLVGMGYANNKFITDRIDRPFGFIMAGGYDDPMLPRASLVFSEYQEQHERRLPDYAAAGKCLVIPKYLDPHLTVEPELVRRDIDVINVGNFVHYGKNQIALANLAKTYSVTLVGKGAVPQEILDAFAGKNAVFTGKLAHADVFKLLWRSKVMAHPSLGDGLPRSIVEALSCGVPVVCLKDTIYGGFEHGKHGFISSREDFDKHVEEILLDDELRARMSRSAREFALRTHGIDAIHDAASVAIGRIYGPVVPTFRQKLGISMRKRMSALKALGNIRTFLS